MPSVARRGIAYAIQHVKGMTRWAGAWTLDAGERLRRPPQSGTNALHSSPASRSGTIEYVNPATGELWDGQGSNPPPRRTRHVYFGLEVIQEYSCGAGWPCETSMPLVREFLHGDPARYPEQVAMIRHNPDTQDQWTYHYLHDVLGSVIGVVNETGTLVERYTYDPYGKVLIEKWQTDGQGGQWLASAEPNSGMPYSPIGNPFMWTGHRYDAAVGLYHTLFRFYDPVLGRWLQRDPEEFVDGINLYEYVRSSPLKLVDPHGDSAVAIVAPWAAGAALADGPLPIGDAAAALALGVATVVDGVLVYKAYRGKKQRDKEKEADREYRLEEKQRAVCTKTYNAYKAACKLKRRCTMADSCDALKSKIKANMACLHGRVIYIGLKCDRFFPNNTADHYAARNKAERSLAKCEANAKAKNCEFSCP